jgi:hypothetical protein
LRKREGETKEKGRKVEKERKGEGRGSREEGVAVKE